MDNTTRCSLPPADSLKIDIAPSLPPNLSLTHSLFSLSLPPPHHLSLAQKASRSQPLSLITFLPTSVAFFTFSLKCSKFPLYMAPNKSNPSSLPVLRTLRGVKKKVDYPFWPRKCSAAQIDISVMHVLLDCKSKSHPNIQAPKPNFSAFSSICSTFLMCERTGNDLGTFREKSSVHQCLSHTKVIAGEKSATTEGEVMHAADSTTFRVRQ